MITYEELKEKCSCWTGYKRKPGTKPCEKGSCIKEGTDDVTEKHHAMVFGRMNPVTSGHEAVVKKLHSVAKEHNAGHSLVVSHSQDAKKNPLSAEQKVKHAKNAFPGTNVSASSKEKPTILHHAAELHKQGVTHLHVVAGSDRHKDMHELLHKYNDKESSHGHYNFKKITVHSSGERDPDSEGTEGMSASKMRAHAAAGNKAEFHKGAPSTMSPKHKDAMYHDVRKGMNIKEETTPYWKKPSFNKRMSRMARQERLERERKEAEKKPVKEETLEQQADRIKQLKGFNDQIKKLGMSKKEIEALQDVNEVLDAKATAGDWIHDFVHSTNPKFNNKSKEKRRQMALAAYYAKKRNEEVELGEAQTGNPTGGYHGSIPSAEDKYKEFHAHVKNLTDGDDKTVKHYLDSGHGKGLVGREDDHNFIKADFKKFMKYYRPEMKSPEVKEETEIEEARMSAAVKLQRAFQREQEKSEASRKRAEQLLNPPKKEPVKEGTIQPNGTDKIDTQTSAPTASTAKDDSTMVKKVKGFKFFRGVNEPNTQMAVKENAPVAPVPDKKYIKGTPEWKAHKEASKPRTGHPTNEEVEQIDELSKDTVKKYKSYATLRAVGQASNIYDREVEGGKKPDPKQHAALAKTNKGLERANARLKEEAEELDEKSQQARRNKTYKNLMDTSRGARVNQDVGLTPSDTGHKNNRDMNKAIGRAVRRGEMHEGTTGKPVDVDKVNTAGQEPHEEKFETVKKTNLKKEETMKTYKEFLESLDEASKKKPAWLLAAELKAEKKEGKLKEETEELEEVKMSELPSRMVKGKSYGADYEDPEGKFETKDDMKKPEKKTAGRKAGSGAGVYKPRKTMSKLKQLGATYK